MQSFSPINMVNMAIYQLAVLLASAFSASALAVEKRAACASYSTSCFLASVPMTMS